MNLPPPRLAHLLAVFFFCLSLAPVNAQQPKAVPRNSGLISGSIVIDGKPAVNVKVELFKLGQDGLRQANIMSIQTSKTGRYIFRGLGPGVYDVSPDTPGAVSSEAIWGYLGKSVVVEPGEAVTEINFNLLSKGSISGRVTDANGHPVVGEAVEYLVKREDGSLYPASSPYARDRTTDAEGFYHTPGLPPGRYVVKIGVPYGLAGYGAKDEKRPHYLQTFHPDVNEATKAVAVEVASAGETTNVDIRVGLPLTTRRISGQIISESGTTLPNIWLGIRTTSENGKATSTLTGNYRSNSNGEFKIFGALPGKYVVYPENDETNNVYGEPISFEVKDSDVTELKIVMRPASSIAGVVSVDGPAALVTSAKLSKLRIVANSVLDGPQARGTTVPIDSGGRFHIPGVHPGRVLLLLEDDSGSTPRDFTILRVERNGMVVSEGFEVGPNQDVSGVKLVLGAGNGVIHGDVEILGGELDGIGLYVHYRPRNSDPDTYSQADVDARGHFLITNLMPGEYELMVGPESSFLTGNGGRRMRSRMPTVKQLVTIAPGGDSEVTLVLTLNPTPMP